MGSSDNFSLRWEDFPSNISASFRELREDSQFFDVTICCDNGEDFVQGIIDQVDSSATNLSILYEYLLYDRCTI